MKIKLPLEIAQVGRLKWHFSSLFEGPDGDAYLPRWEINPAALSTNKKYGFVLQRVARYWSWFPYLFVTVAEPIEIDDLSKWQGVSAGATRNLHHHRPVPDQDGKTGFES